LLDRLGAEFGQLDVIKLGGGGNRWRLRVGRWRVILALDNTAGTITVTRVLDRKEAYRD
jgi:mRNA-degrading endonuclease RelE of RelBE toxin-antitoxin system